MRALALLLLLATTPAHADVIADMMADRLDCIDHRRAQGRALRACEAERHLASLEPSWSPWLAWGLGVVGAAALVGGVVVAQDQQHRNIGIFTGASGAILVVAGGYAAAW